MCPEVRIFEAITDGISHFIETFVSRVIVLMLLKIVAQPLPISNKVGKAHIGKFFLKISLFGRIHVILSFLISHYTSLNGFLVENKVLVSLLHHQHLLILGANEAGMSPGPVLVVRPSKNYAPTAVLSLDEHHVNFLMIQCLLNRKE